MKQWLRGWWDGKYISPDNPPNSAVFILQGHHERHWTARRAQVAWDHWKEHHRWIIGLLFGLLVVLIVKRK